MPRSLLVLKQPEGTYTLSVGIDKIPSYVNNSDGFLFRKTGKKLHLLFFQQKQKMGTLTFNLPEKTPDDLGDSGLFRVELQPSKKEDAVAFIAMDEQYASRYT